MASRLRARRVKQCAVHPMFGVCHLVSASPARAHHTGRRAWLMHDIREGHFHNPPGSPIPAVLQSITTEASSSQGHRAQGQRPPASVAAAAAHVVLTKLLIIPLRWRGYILLPPQSLGEMRFAREGVALLPGQRGRQTYLGWAIHGPVRHTHIAGSSRPRRKASDADVDRGLGKSDLYANTNRAPQSGHKADCSPAEPGEMVCTNQILPTTIGRRN